MAKRGKILRDTSAGPGLVMVDGQQHAFPLEGVWKSEIPPRPGLAVDVEFDEIGGVRSIMAVPEGQIAKEQASQAMSAMRAKSGALATSAVARFGMPTLVATAVLLIGWFFLSAISYDTGFAGKIDLTFWRVLAFINASNPLQALSTIQGGGSAGFYGLLAVIALCGPFLAYFWKDKRAVLGGLLPLLFMLLIVVLVRNSIMSMAGTGPAEMVKAAEAEISKHVSIGIGFYASFLAALFLAFNSVKKFLVSKASA